MDPYRVLITSKYLQQPDEHEELVRFLNEHNIETVFRRANTEEELLDLLPAMDGLICHPAPLNARVLDAAKRLKVIARTGVGYETIDVPAATARGIAVCTTPGANRISVAELTMALMLACARNLPQNLAEVRQGGWKPAMGFELGGRTLGILGLGLIGKAVAQRARAFEMRILATELFPDEAFAAANRVSYVPLEQLLKESDFVSLHLFLDDKSRHLIDASRLALMKPTAWLINTARGGIVDTGALIAALQAGQIAGAALDVLEEEPPGETPLRSLPNVLLTPHAGAATGEFRERSAQMAAGAVVSVLRGERPAYILNPEVFPA